MRDKLCLTLMDKVAEPDFVFFTGDLGFMALEPLRDLLGNRFINVGVAEQNMVSISAGMAKVGWKPWIYSIGPFLYARPYEQIRNDICLNDLPVRLIGNGGGYSYGAMGATHHSLEDYGALLPLQNINVFIPAFSEDLSDIVAKIDNNPHPTYLRLGRCEKPTDIVLPKYASWRRLKEGDGPTMVVVGPLVGGIIKEISSNAVEKSPDLWILTELPLKIDEIPDLFFESLKQSKHLIVVEEHYAYGSVGQALTYLLSTIGLVLPKFTHKYAKGYITGLYGSQVFHRRESGLDPASVLSLL